LKFQGLSIGITDCNPTDQKLKDTVSKEIERSKLLADSFGGHVDDPIEQDRRERQIIASIDNVKKIGDKF